MFGEQFSFLELLVFLLIGLLFFREDIMPWVKQKLGFNTDNHPATKEEFTELSNHVNHTQTEMLERQTKTLEKQTESLGEIRDCVKVIADGIKDVHNKHQEWDKYGIKTRCDKK